MPLPLARIAYTALALHGTAWVLGASLQTVCQYRVGTAYCFFGHTVSRPTFALLGLTTLSLFAASTATLLACGIAAAARHLKPTASHPARCPTCGYDLRATPIRCPECGTPSNKYT